MNKNTELEIFVATLNTFVHDRDRIIEETKKLQIQCATLYGLINDVLSRVELKSKSQYDQAQETIKEFLEPLHKEM